MLENSTNLEDGNETIKSDETAQPNLSEQKNEEYEQRVSNRTLRPQSTTFKDFMTSGWQSQDELIEPLESSGYTPERLAALGSHFVGERLVIPAGSRKVRSNDCDYAFRPDTTFAYYTGLGQDYEAGAVLVLEPLPSSCEGDESGNDGSAQATHEPQLFVQPRADQSTEDYYMNASYGEYWVGPRAGIVELEAMTGIHTHDIAQLQDALAKDVGTESGAVRLRVVAETDEAITRMVQTIRHEAGFNDDDACAADDAKLHEVAAEARIIKDDYEIRQMQLAIDATHQGFNRLLNRLPRVVNLERSERMLEGAFNSVSRELGNAVGYDSIIASGAHAPILHWMRNTGKVSDGELLLVDAGVEVDSLYTADITRTFPVNGKFTALQRDIYETVLRAQIAGFEAAQVGATYSDIHHACMRVLAEKLDEWGILPVSVETSLSPEGQHHRRWHACGCAHHLGLDVHDCAQARQEQYQGAKLAPGMIFTIEPGLYFKENDMLVPPEFRGIGVRIEDDVLMTEDGPQWMSVNIPKTVDEVEAWMAAQALIDPSQHCTAEVIS